MKVLFLMPVIFSLMLVSFQSAKSQTKDEEQAMKALIEDIIINPVMMIETMNDNVIDCTNIVQLFKNKESYLIDFTLQITYIKCRNYKFAGIDESINPLTKEKRYQLYYEADKVINSKDFFRFAFVMEDNRLIFKGITRPID